ncbi:hypothetical protein BRARA_C04269 [Brassica rapa]|uniref:DUF4283 domain-containing protein n=1 Tax=Brassica campestris TaxID=3711 RepID=A0A398A4M2_BRACM|nr:hypothetical protein BRARA_C04269 [Brassica rapa]
MAGASSLKQAADPPDPGAETFGSGSALHPSQFPPLPHSPEAVSKPQVSPPTFPSSPWGSGKSVVPGLSPDNRATTMVNLESSSTTMDISPTTVPIQISGKGLDKLQTLPSAKIKEIDFISAQYTTFSAKTKGAPPPAAAILFGTVENPKTDITPPVVTSEFSKVLPPASGPEILPDPFSKPSKITPSVPVTVPFPVGYTIPLVPEGSGQENPSVDANSQNPPNKDPHTSGNSSKPHPSDRTYAGKAKMGTDRSLKRLAPLVFSPEGIPQVKIPDEVFNRGAEAHKDFVIGVFTGKTPSYSQIQSVLSHIWGKGTKLVIHLRPQTHSMLVKIPNEFIRRKVVEQEIWHIGTSMFYVAQWSAQLAITPPTMDSIPLWAHVRGVPFDLYTREGLSLVAGNIGDPVEADEFTIRMVSLDVAHLKIRANCTKPLPSVAELIRSDGSIIQVSVTYPWVPPTCPCCNRLGHLEQRCPNAKWAPSAKDDSNASDIAKQSNHQKSTNHPPPAPLSPSLDKGKGPSHHPMADSVTSSAFATDGTAEGNTPTDGARTKASSSQDTQVAIPFSLGSVSLEVGNQAVKPYIHVSSSKKRKGAHLSRRSSPDAIGGISNANLFSGNYLANPFALLESRNLGHLSSTDFPFNNKEPYGQPGDSSIASAIVPSSERLTTPVKGSSPPGGRNTTNL